MSIDLSNDELVPLSQVPDLPCVPRRRKGRPLHRATVYRWSNTGVKGVVLETVQFAGTRCTTLRALREFVGRLSKPHAGDGSGKSCVPTERINVDERLDKAGI